MGALKGSGEERRWKGGREGCHDLLCGSRAGEVARPSGQVPGRGDRVLRARAGPALSPFPLSRSESLVGGGQKRRAPHHHHPPQEGARERLGSDPSALSLFVTRERKEIGALPGGARGLGDGRAARREWAGSPVNCQASPRAAARTGPTAWAPYCRTQRSGDLGESRLRRALQVTEQGLLGEYWWRSKVVGIERRSWRRGHSVSRHSLSRLQWISRVLL